MLRVRVPADAVVTVNDHETESGGQDRKFMSRGLKDGFVYTYVVKATYDIDGESQTTTKTIKLRPGDIESLDFTADASDEPADEAAQAKTPGDDLVTVVRLSVPENALVTLAGNPTGGSGLVRTFRTKQLKAGEVWDDYTIAVTAEVDGRDVTKQRTISVTAGQQVELDFDFADRSLVSR